MKNDKNGRYENDLLIDKWIAENQGKHFCHCGCEEKIEILRSYYWDGIPKYITPHLRMRVDRWVADNQGKHFCRCGCGSEINVVYDHYYKGIPKYISGHQRRGKDIL